MRTYPNARRLAGDNGATQFGTAAGQTQGYSIANTTPGYSLNPLAFTMCAWIHTSAVGSQQGFFGFGDRTGATLGINCLIDTGPNEFLLFTDSANAVDFGPTLVANRWYFFACTGGATLLTGYVRQSQLDFQTGTVANTTVNPAISTLVAGNIFAVTGGIAEASMTDFQLYSYAKTQVELEQQSRQRQPVSLRGLVTYLPLRNIGQRLDVVSGQQWTRNGTATNYKNARVAPPVPEVARGKNHLWFS